MAHFVPADFATKCDECDDPISVDTLVMHVYIRTPAMSIGSFHRTRKTYCEHCGKLYLESQWKTGSLSQ